MASCNPKRRLFSWDCGAFVMPFCSCDDLRFELSTTEVFYEELSETQLSGIPRHAV
nr:MAG TPA: hypothetical protein [Caudoviricetes sp.]